MVKFQRMVLIQDPHITVFLGIEVELLSPKVQIAFAITVDSDSTSENEKHFIVGCLRDFNDVVVFWSQRRKRLDRLKTRCILLPKHFESYQSV